MTLTVSPKAESRVSASSEALEGTSSPVETVTSTVFMGSGPALKNWKLHGEGPQAELPNAEIALDDSDEDVAPKATRGLSDRSINAGRPVAPVWLQIAQALAVFMTVAWLTYASIYIVALPGSMKSILSSPLTLGGILASVLAPVAMLWLCIATWQRRSDAHIYAQALREELRGMLFPNPEQTNAINDDIRALMKQAAEMSASSRAAMKAIQRARTGLRTEIRDFAGLSQKAEFHIDRLADSLSKRASELLSLTETIEVQSEVIASKAQRGVGMWENVSAEITELSEEIGTVFSKGAEKLVDASEKAQEKIKDINDQIESVRDNLDSQSSKLGDVSTSLNEGVERLETSLGNAEHISSAVEGVVDMLSSTLGKVEGTAENLFARTDSIEKALEDRADTLKESADKLLSSTDSLQEVGERATYKLGEALSMAISGAETINSAVRRSKEMMDKTVVEASNQIEQTSKIADEKLSALMGEASQNRDRLVGLIDEIEKRQVSLTQSAKGLDETRAKISDSADKALISLQQATTQMVTRSEEPLENINAAIERMQAQTQNIDEKLSVRVVEVSQETGKLKELVDGVSSTLKNSVQELAQTSSQVTSQSRAITDEVSGQRDILRSMVSELEDNTKVIAELMQGQAQNLETSLADTESKVSVLGQMFFDKGDSLVEKVIGAAEKVSVCESQINVALSAIDKKSTDIEKSVQSQIDNITRLSAGIEPEAEKLIEQAERLNAKYAALKDGYTATTDVARTCLIDLGDKLESRIEKLGSETLETSKVFLSVADDLSHSMQDIRRVSEDAQEKMSTVQVGIKGRVDDLQLVTEQVKVKVDYLQSNLDGYIKDLSGIVGKAVTELEDATGKFGKTAYMVDEKAEEATSKLIGSTRQFAEEGHRMSMLGEQAVHKASRIISVVQEESERLVDVSRASLTDLQRSGDTLAVRAKEIEEYIRSSINHTKAYGDELREQAVQISNHSADVVGQISDATMRLASRAGDVKQIGHSVAEDIELSRERLEDESVKLSGVAKRTIEAADEAAIVFTKHSAALQRNVEDMIEQARKAREGQMRNERESFLTASKFVIESLYSLAVDVARHLEGDLDLRVLKAYQKGDVAAYAHHLAEIAPKIPAARSQRKFIEDGEFRTYVLRFIRQYEELLEQAHSKDYADLLGSVFATSDVGKLYRILCEIAGKSPKDY